jgi:hypothetical protein
MKRIIILLAVFLPGFVFFAPGCLRECNCPSGITKIEYGTSFGECYGYCKRSISVTAKNISFTKEGWPDEFKPKSCSNPFTREQFIVLTSKIRPDEFNNLDEVIGCPDCADGGAEWIRIVTALTNHKVTFEYWNEPVELKDIIGLLRDYLSDFENCD